MKDITFQYYPANIKITKPSGVVTLERFVKAITNPKPRLIVTMQKIREASEANNLTLKTQLKESLFFFTPSAVVTDSRRYENISHFTGLMPLDFDKLQSRQYAEELKEAFFNSVDNCVFAWLSSSGKGFRCLIKIPVVTSVAEFQAHFAAAQKKWGDISGFDQAPKNAVLPLFISVDRKALVRWDAVDFYEKIYPEKPKKIAVNYVQSTETNRVLATIERKINNITDFGHPIVRATAYYVGGLCAAGKCNELDALQKLESCIQSHPYLSNAAKVKGYLKTAREMFEKGKTQATDFI